MEADQSKRSAVLAGPDQQPLTDRTVDRGLAECHADDLAD